MSLAVGGLAFEGELVRGDRAARIQQLVPLDRSDAVEELPPPRRLGTALEGRLVEGDALLGVALLLEELVDAGQELDPEIQVRVFVVVVLCLFRFARSFVRSFVARPKTRCGLSRLG